MCCVSIDTIIRLWLIFYENNMKYSFNTVYRDGNMAKHRTVRLPSGLADSIDGFLETKKAHNLGLHTITSVVEYATRKLIDK